MDVMSIIDSLEDVIDKGSSVPFTGKYLMDKQELLEIISELRLRLPDDIKQAKWVKDERQRIIIEAQKEASTIIKNAEDKIISMINDHDITRKAQEKAAEIINRAQKRAREINEGALIHADEILADAEKILETTLSSLREDRSSIRIKDSARREKPAAQ